jgi:hypothetical protein
MGGASIGAPNQRIGRAVGGSCHGGRRTGASVPVGAPTRLGRSSISSGRVEKLRLQSSSKYRNRAVEEYKFYSLNQIGVRLCWEYNRDFTSLIILLEMLLLVNITTWTNDVAALK